MGVALALARSLVVWSVLHLTMLIHWKTADVCILSTIEMKLRGHPSGNS